MSSIPIVGLPGVGNTREVSYRRVTSGSHPTMHLPGGVVIAGAYASDPGNTTHPYVLRAGLAMGKRTADSLYAASILGVTSESIEGNETVIDIPAATATEIIRRIGATGTVKFTGPPVASGTVRTMTATFSSVGASSITITALGVAAVWTLTNTAGADGGSFGIRVTLPSGVAAETAVLAYNESAANIQTALEALANVGAGNVTVSGSAGGPYTVTFSSNLGAVTVSTVNDSTNDGAVWEGGVVVAQTTAGVDGRFVTGSLIQPTDGSETPLGLIDDGSGLRVADADLTRVSVQYANLIIGGHVNATQIIDFPADTSTATWLKTQLNSVNGSAFVFTNTFN